MVKISDDAAKTIQFILDNDKNGLNINDLLESHQKVTKSHNPTDKDEWLTLKAASLFAKVSKWTLMRWRAKGLKIIKTSHAKTSRIIISKASLDAILESLSISGPEIK